MTIVAIIALLLILANLKAILECIAGAFILLAGVAFIIVAFAVRILGAIVGAVYLAITE